MHKHLPVSSQSVFFVVVITVILTTLGCAYYNYVQHQRIVDLITDHARAWETGDLDLMLSTVHDDIVFAYPGRRLDKAALVEDFKGFSESFTDTKIYVHDIISRKDSVAVEWQFATTNNDGIRTAVSDGIIGKVKDGKIVSWKVYLDGRVSRMQIAGELPLEEGALPFPWPQASGR